MSSEANKPGTGRFKKLARVVNLLLQSFNINVAPPLSTVSSGAAASDHDHVATMAGSRRKVSRQQMSLSELTRPDIRQEISERVQHRLQTDLSSLTKQHREKDQFCPVVSEEVQTILTNSPWNRDHSEVEQATRALKVCSAFSDYSSSIQKSLCKIGWYQRLETGRVIIREGHLPSCFYFILSGTVQVLRKGSARMELLEAGQTFGDIAILKHMPREATFVARTETELLVISKSDYIDLSLRQSSRSFQQTKHFSFCQSINLLRYWPLSLLESQPELCKVAKFKPNTVVVKDSKRSNWLYVIMAGSCRVVKRFVDSSEASGRRHPVQSYPATDLRPSKLALMTAATASGTTKTGAGGGIEGGEKTQVGDLASPGKKRRIGQSRSLGSLQTPKSREQQMLGSPHPAINKQFLVQLQILQPKDVFGMSSLIHPDEPSVTLVSNGAELVMISKDFITSHLNSELKLKLQRQVVQFPSEEAMRKRIRDHYAWNVYKQTMTSQMRKRIS